MNFRKLLYLLLISMFLVAANSEINYRLPDIVTKCIEDYLTSYSGAKPSYFCLIRKWEDTTNVSLVEYQSPPITICDSLILKSNRYLLLGDKRIPVMFYEDFEFSDFVNVLMSDSSVVKHCHRVGGGYSILFKGRGNNCVILKKGEKY